MLTARQKWHRQRKLAVRRSLSIFAVRSRLAVRQRKPAVRRNTAKWQRLNISVSASHV